MVKRVTPVEVRLVRGREEKTLTQVLGSGGEGDVFLVPGTDLVAKLFHAPTPDLEEKVTAMIEKPLPGPGLLPPDYSFGWPVDIVCRADDGGFLGFVMPRFKWEYTLFQAYHPRKRGPDVDQAYLFRAGKNLAMALHELHRSKVVAGDVNESNAVFGRGGHAILLDTDSFQIKSRSGRVFRCAVGKADFTAPEYVGKKFAEVDRTTHSDSFALAVALWLLLMQGNHPFASRYTGPGQGLPLPERIAQGIWPYGKAPNPHYRPRKDAPRLESLAPGLQALFRRAFEDGQKDETLRPKPADWVRAIEAAEVYVGTKRGRWREIYYSQAPRLKVEALTALLSRAREAARNRWAWVGGAAAAVLIAFIVFLPRISSGVRERPARPPGVKGQETPGIVKELRGRPGSP